MSYKRGNAFVIKAEPPRTCQMCGAVKECRPYGPGGMVVCFPCAMKDREEAEKQFAKRLEGKP